MLTTSRADGEGSGVDVGEGWSDVQAQKQEDKGMLQSAQEMVAKALGGGSRGSFPPPPFFRVACGCKLSNADEYRV